MPQQRPDRVAEYEALLPALNSLREVLLASLDVELRHLDVRLAVPLESRVKTWDSILGKLERGVAKIRDFREYHDLVGIRVVVPFTTDLAKATDAICAACHVIEAYRTADRLASDRFGYMASHFVVKPHSRSQLQGDWHGLTAEVQLLTAAQHIWAQSSHVLQYKSHETTPPELRRSVSRVAALLELVDLELERLIHAREAYRRSLQLEDDALILDVDILDAVLPKLWPPEHPHDPSMNGMVLGALHRHGIRRLGELRRLVSTQRSAVFADSLAHAQELLEAVDHGEKQGNSYTIQTPTRITSHDGVTQDLIERARRGVFYALSGLTFTALQFAFGEREPPPGTKTPFVPPPG